MTDFTICIPHRGNGLGLWATVNSCEVDLLDSGLTWNYSIICNGDKRVDDGTKVLLHELKSKNKLVYSEVRKDPLSPPDARQIASEHADGRILCFFDNHCIPHRDYFERVNADFDALDIGILHSTTEFHPEDSHHYHYRLLLDTTFWATSEFIIPNIYKPYRCAAAGHGGFSVLNDTWKKFGGYGPRGVFSGYAGEELTTDLKFWMRGSSVWIDPKVIHSHYVGKRSYPRHYSDDYFINLMASANIIGGEKWLYKVCDHFLTRPRRRSGKTMFDLMRLAIDRSKDYASEVRLTSQMDLSQLLDYFQTNLIPF